MGNDFEVMCVGCSSTAGNVIDRPAPDIFGLLLTNGIVCLRVTEIWNVSNLCKIRSANYDVISACLTMKMKCLFSLLLTTKLLSEI